jgi:hypothetical protein
VPLVARVSHLLKEKQEASTSVWVFPGESPKHPLLGASLAHMHTKVCRPIVRGKRQLRFDKDFVLHSPRHAALTGSEKLRPIRLQSCEWRGTPT